MGKLPYVQEMRARLQHLLSLGASSLLLLELTLYHEFTCCLLDVKFSVYCVQMQVKLIINQFAIINLNLQRSN